MAKICGFILLLLEYFISGPKTNLCLTSCFRIIFLSLIDCCELRFLIDTLPIDQN